MGVVAIDARRVPIVVQQDSLRGVMLICRRREGMANLWRRIFGKHVRVLRHRRDVCAAVVTGDAVLFILPAQQPGCAAGIVRCVTCDACIGCDRGIAAYQCLR